MDSLSVGDIKQKLTFLYNIFVFLLILFDQYNVIIYRGKYKYPKTGFHYCAENIPNFQRKELNFAYVLIQIESLYFQHCIFFQKKINCILLFSQLIYFL